MVMNLLNRIRFYLKGNRIVIPTTVKVEVSYDITGDAYVIIEFKNDKGIKYQVIMHEEDAKSFVKELKKEAPRSFS